MHLIGAPLQPGEEAPETVPDPGLPLPLALDHPVPIRLGQVAPGHVGREPAGLRKAQQVLLDLRVAVRLDGPDRPLQQRLGRVRDHQTPVDADGAAETAAGLAGPNRRVEREEVGQRLPIGNVAVRAVQGGGEAPGFARCLLRSDGPSGINQQPTMAALHGRLDRLQGATPVFIGKPQPVLDHRQHRAVLVQQPHIALLGEHLPDLRYSQRLRHRHLEADLYPRGLALGPGPELGPDGLRRIPPHLASAAPAEEPRRPGVK